MSGGEKKYYNFETICFIYYKIVKKMNGNYFFVSLPEFI